MLNARAISAVHHGLRMMAALSIAASLLACSDEPEVISEDSGTAGTDLESSSSPETTVALDSHNSTPRIDDIRFEPRAPVAGDSLRVVVDVSDAENNRIWLDYAWAVDGVAQVGGLPKIVLNGVSKGEVIEVTVIASDGRSQTEGRTEEVTVQNSAPRITRLVVDPGKEIVAGSVVTIRPEARDPDGDPITFEYAWAINGRSVTESSSTLDTEELRRGDHIQVAVTASDGDSESEVLETHPMKVVNAAPVFLSTPPRPRADGSFRYPVRAEDPDGDADLQFALEAPPPGMTIGVSSGEIAWLPTPSQVGTHAISVIVDDLQGGRRKQTFEIEVRSGQAGPAASAPR